MSKRNRCVGNIVIYTLFLIFCLVSKSLRPFALIFAVIVTYYVYRLIKKKDSKYENPVVTEIKKKTKKENEREKEYKKYIKFIEDEFDFNPELYYDGEENEK